MYIIMYFVACSEADTDWGLFKAFSRLPNGSCLAIASNLFDALYMESNLVLLQLMETGL